MQSLHTLYEFPKRKLDKINRLYKLSSKVFKKKIFFVAFFDRPLGSFLFFALLIKDILF